jgi:hypothetical protein
MGTNALRGGCRSWFSSYDAWSEESDQAQHTAPPTAGADRAVTNWFQTPTGHAECETSAADADGGLVNVA